MPSQVLRVIVLTALACLLGHVAAQQAPLSPAALAYTPHSSPCPRGTTLVRRAGKERPTLSHGESEYITERKKRVLPHTWSTYLATVEKSAAAHRIAVPAYVSRILGGKSPGRAFPTLGIATSGGGTRAAYFGAGVLNALDGRNTTAVHAGTGGLLQSASYLASLSGGGWMATSLIQADFPTFHALIFGSNVTTKTPDVFGGWHTDIALLSLSDTNATLNDEFVSTLLEELAGKRAAGFPVTFGDFWSRSLARHFTNGTSEANFLDPTFTHGAGVLVSGLTELSSFKTHEMPFPIVLSDSVSQFEDKSAIIPGDAVPLTNPIYEYNFFEFGSFDPMLAAFIPTRLLGSQGDKCVTNYDQVSFVAGATSNLWSELNVTEAIFEASSIGPLVEAINQTFPQTHIRLDASLIPNPFLGVEPESFIDSNQTLLALVDGGIDGQLMPVQPLLVKSRDVDVIIAIDASADTVDSFTNGSSLIAIQARASLFPSSYSFPAVPKSAEEFVARNLTSRPTFFGCDSSRAAPLVVYIANGAAPLGQAPLTNVPTFQETFPLSEIQGFLDQTHDIATQGIPVDKTQKDPEWPVCLACAVVDRTRARLGERRSGACEGCMARYCAS